MAVKMSERIKKVRAKIEQGWTQGVLARSVDGSSVTSFDPEATCWCLAGACFATADVKDTDNSFGEPYLHHNVIFDYIKMSLTEYNDKKGRTQQEVLDMLDEVIAKEIENESA